MKRWSESEWAEWRAEREAILLENGYDGPNVRDFVATLQAIESYRLRCESRGLRGDEVETPMPKQMEMPI